MQTRISAWTVRQFFLVNHIAVVFLLDMAKPGYGQFALGGELRPLVAQFSTSVKSDLEQALQQVSPPTPNYPQSPLQTKHNHQGNCRTRLDAYRGAKCNFTPPTNY